MRTTPAVVESNKKTFDDPLKEKIFVIETDVIETDVYTRHLRISKVRDGCIPRRHRERTSCKEVKRQVSVKPTHK